MDTLTAYKKLEEYNIPIGERLEIKNALTKHHLENFPFIEKDLAENGDPCYRSTIIPFKINFPTLESANLGNALFMINKKVKSEDFVALMKVCIKTSQN